MKRTAVLLALALVVGSAVAWAQDWGNFALISNTLGVNANRICIGEGVRPTDIGCPVYTPTIDALGLMTVANVSVTGAVSVTGNVSANKFIGDGSELTGVVAVSGDRITSGTTQMVAISDTSYISITTGGVTTGYFTPAGVLVANGISVCTNRMSATTGYFSGNVGIGTKAASASLHVSGTISATDAIQVGASRLDCTSGIPGALRFESGVLEVCDGSDWRSAGGDALGDRIVSGTTTARIESATGIISLTTAGVHWGYLSSGGSYLPSMGSALVSSTIVSATNISSTYVHLASDTAPLACGAGLEGAMRYTSGTMQVCDGSNWGNIGIGVPTGTIAAFEASSCPAGWSEYTSARGRFLRGIDTLAAGIDPDGTRSAGNTQGDGAPNITGSMMLRHYAGGTSPHSVSGAFMRTDGPDGNQYAQDAGAAAQYTIGFDASNSSSKYGAADEIRPKNVAVTFCQYAGFDSELSAGVATLASLSDVSVGGASTGQALVFDGASWVPSTTSVGAINDLSDVDTSGVAAGSYLRYDGGNWVVSTTYDVTVPDGDRITSGTLAVVANSETSIISLSTNGSDWGYLRAAGNSFLPRIGTNYVSSTLISTTYVQLSSATDVLECNAGFTGAMRYISGTMQVCDGNEWGNIGIGIPGGTIAAFEAATCPSGWSEYTPARGRFLRGLDNGAGNDPDWPRVAGSAQGDEIRAHLHSVDPPSTNTGTDGAHSHSYWRPSGAGENWAEIGTGRKRDTGASTGSAGNHNHTVNIPQFNSGNTGGAETRPKNVAVIFCQYEGFQSSVSLEATISPTFDNSWVDYGSGYSTAGYFKDSSGMVHLEGLVKDGAIPACIFTLPVGYRPNAVKVFSVRVSGGTGRVDVGADGCVNVAGGNNTSLSLDGISFRAAL